MATVSRTVGPSSGGAGGEGDDTPPKKGKKKLILMLVAVLVAVGGGLGGYFAFAGKDGPEPPPEPGAVVKMDPINVNLAGGHYLKFGIALQATLEAGEEVDGSHALDIAISELSNREVSELSSSEAREKVKHELVEKIKEAYEGEIITVYFTDFVMQ